MNYENKQRKKKGAGSMMQTRIENGTRCKCKNMCIYMNMCTCMATCCQNRKMLPGLPLHKTSLQFERM